MWLAFWQAALRRRGLPWQGDGVGLKDFLMMMMPRSCCCCCCCIMLLCCIICLLFRFVFFCWGVCEWSLDCSHWDVGTCVELPCLIAMTRESTEDERFLRSACRRRGSQQVEACRFGVAEYSWRFAKQMMLLRKDNFFNSQVYHSRTGHLWFRHLVEHCFAPRVRSKSWTDETRKLVIRP